MYSQISLEDPLDTKIIDDTLLDFVNSNKQTITLYDYDSLERQYTHEYCEKLNLKHLFYSSQKDLF